MKNKDKKKKQNKNEVIDKKIQTQNNGKDYYEDVKQEEIKDNNKNNDDE